ncbi:MAG: hypothetical protein H7Y37_08100 [Anaerolineae bacterium]|nr:hypothetical protein [Gloeobacterales cyanobacterium ES-bin-313]
MEANRLETLLHLFLAGLVSAALVLFVNESNPSVADDDVPTLAEIVVHPKPAPVRACTDNSSVRG